MLFFVVVIEYNLYVVLLHSRQTFLFPRFVTAFHTYGIDRLVEELIRDSMAKGDFNNLRGAGKPLKYQTPNPFVDTATQKINQVRGSNVMGIN